MGAGTDGRERDGGPLFRFGTKIIKKVVGEESVVTAETSTARPKYSQQRPRWRLPNGNGTPAWLA